MTEVVPVVRKRGRPRKADIEAAKKPGNGKVGRPVGDNGRIQELKARLMATAGTKVIDKIIHIALNDEHPGQMAALKLCIDRQLPLSLFEKDAKRGSNAITINITGVSGLNTEDTVIDADDVDYEEQEE
jgi:hypothetical protein